MQRLDRLQAVAYPICGLVAVLVGWWIVTETDLISGAFIAGPLEVSREFRSQMVSGVMTTHALTTIRAIVVSLGLCCVTGIPAGLAIGSSKKLFRAAEPLMGFYLSVPLIAFMAIIVVWFGFGLPSVIVLGWLTGVMFVVLNTSMGVANVDSTLRRVGLVFCQGRVRQAMKIAVVAALPTVAAGIRLATGRVIAGVVVGEMFASNSGLGFRLVRTANYFEIEGFYAVLVSLIIVSSLMVTIVSTFEKRVNRGFAAL